MTDKDIREKIIAAFRHSDFKWRTARGIASDTGVPIAQVIEYLERSPTVTRSKKPNSQGRPLFSLAQGVSGGGEPTVFVFQSVPEQYDLREKLRAGQSDTWYATRYRAEMRPRDVVFFWMGGDRHFRGLYGWGEITKAPYLKSEWDSYGVEVRYEEKFKKPILATTIETDPVLSSLLIFRAPQATNFMLSPEQAKKLVRLIKERGERTPRIAESAHE
jgi:hypothetical protein